MNILNIFNKEPKTAEERARKFAKKHSLEYCEFNNGMHMRVKNPQTRKFVDFWITGKMKQVNGVYSHVGHRGRRLQIDLDILIGKYPKKKEVTK